MSVATHASRPLGQGHRRRHIIRLAVFGVVMYGSAVAVVRVLDYWTNLDQLAQLTQQGGTLTEVRCDSCAGAGTALAAWATDGRALLLWALIALATAIGIMIDRRTSNSHRRAAR